MNNIPFISADEIRKKLTVSRAIAVMQQALVSQVHKESHCPVRTLIRQNNPLAVFGSMPGLYTDKKIFVNKIATFVEHNDPTQPLVNCIVVVFDAGTGKPLALIEGGELTQLKCAAVVGAVTAQCASPAARKLALAGAGNLARQQLLAVLAVRDIRQVNLYNRSDNRVRQLAEYISCEWPEIDVVISKSADDAVNDADIICSATGSFTPIFSTNNIKENVHMNIMGAHTPLAREVPQQWIKESFVVVEDRETAIKEAGSLHENAIDLFELAKKDQSSLMNRKTLFSSTGHIMMDMILTGEILSQFGIVE
ncbi:hypothetical protein ABW286_12360 [Erwinia papayae]|uniref:Ornithine cyclodeaminase n=1 Tax=Erwinia papayae TaxID=206499 RepID=A0ABV3N2G2_9GAMM